MRKTSLLGILALSLLVAGCERDYQWDPNNIDEGAASRPFNTLESGTKWRLLRDTGNRTPTPDEGYWVHYKGWCINDDGTEVMFDQSYSMGVGSYFGAGQTVSGFYEGMLNCPEGGMIELEIPPDQGYGDKELELIPANSTLHFRIELIRIENYE